MHAKDWDTLDKAYILYILLIDLKANSVEVILSQEFKQW